MDEAKIYNVCLQRVKFQITSAKLRYGGLPAGGSVILESYNTGDLDEIVDILEIYDLEDRTAEGLLDKLDDLAYTVSVLVKERVSYAYDDFGNLGLYLTVPGRLGEVYEAAGAEAAVSA